MSQPGKKVSQFRRSTTIKTKKDQVQRPARSPLVGWPGMGDRRATPHSVVHVNMKKAALSQPICTSSATQKRLSSKKPEPSHAATPRKPMLQAEVRHELNISLPHRASQSDGNCSSNRDVDGGGKARGV